VLEDKDCINQATTSSSQQLNASHGHIWWLNGGPYVVLSTDEKKPGRLLPAPTKNNYATHGKLVRRLYVIPS